MIRDDDSQKAILELTEKLEFEDLDQSRSRETPLFGMGKDILSTTLLR